MTENMDQGDFEVRDRCTPPASLHSVPDLPETGTLQFAENVAVMAGEWQLPHENDYDRVQEIVAGAVQLVPGCQHAALVVFDTNGQLVAKAVSGPETAPMIALQNQLGEGPCRDTAATNLTFRSVDVAADTRWTHFAGSAHELGIGSMLCTPLMVGRRCYGSLSMASGVPNAFDEESEALAAVFAAHAAIALADAERLESLTTAVQTRDLIGQAKGILMERFGLTADRAFSVLVRESTHSNVKLRQVSETLCLTGKLPSDAWPSMP